MEICIGFADEQIEGVVVKAKRTISHGQYSLCGLRLLNQFLTFLTSFFSFNKGADHACKDLANWPHF